MILYRAKIGNAVGQWNVAESKPPDEILGFPVETLEVVPRDRIRELEAEIEQLKAWHNQ